MQDPIGEISAHEWLDMMPVGAMILREERILWVNQRLADWLGGVKESLAGLSQEAAESLGLAGLFEGGDGVVSVFPGNGTEFYFRRRCLALANGGEVCFFENLAEWRGLERERDHFRQLAQELEVKDPETGLLNRKAILQALELQVSRSRRYGNPLSLIRLILSPPVEPPCPGSLKEFALELKAELRWADQIGRLDKSSLLLILPETPGVGAEMLATKLGHERAAPTGEGHWRIEAIVDAWQTGDDTRKLLRRLDPDFSEI
ncbi:GGDEF domain-containing protein [Methylomagnum sp.]